MNGVMRMPPNHIRGPSARNGLGSMYTSVNA